MTLYSLGGNISNEPKILNKIFTSGVTHLYFLKFKIKINYYINKKYIYLFQYITDLILLYSSDEERL